MYRDLCTCVYLFVYTHQNSLNIITMTNRPVGGSTALKRLMTEYKELTINPPEGITAGPISEDNFFVWEALIP